MLDILVKADYPFCRLNMILFRQRSKERKKKQQHFLFMFLNKSITMGLLFSAFTHVVIVKQLYFFLP